jgi:hypothetical protein
MRRSRGHDPWCTGRAKPAADSQAEKRAVAHTALCVAAQRGVQRGHRTRRRAWHSRCNSRGMNSTRTIESTLDVTSRTEMASAEAPADALATKVFAATMTYVVIFITATVLLIAL